MIDHELGIEENKPQTKENFMQQLHVDRIKTRIKKAVKETVEAFTAIVDGFEGESEEFRTMNPLEKKEFLTELLNELYSEVDEKFQLNGLVDVAFTDFIIPKGVEMAYDFSYPQKENAKNG